ncbi:UNVERIFIED_CONTAM: hypothetical protein HDU68_006480 [Siphonaria sp. JEL0065]|nr:hypothetical protein HDU68_006480 [Siphonaria sp. JEL0065]
MASLAITQVAWLLIAVGLVRATQVTIKSGGASFPAPAYIAAVADFNTLYNADIESFAFIASDSTTGQKNTYSGIFNFGGSDVAINIPEPNGTNIVALPAVAGGIGISYNLPGISQNVKLSRTALPRIFDGTITKWNDPALLKDNPFLANITNTIMVVVRSSGSGTSQNLVRGLGLMDKSTGYANSPFMAKGFKISLKNSFTAATTASASIIVGSVPYSMTYLNQLEAKDLEANSPTLTTTALIQHVNGDFVGWSSVAGQLAVNSIEASAIHNLDTKTQSLSVIDTPVAGSYPWTIVSNFIINPTNISSDYMTTIWTLRFLWFFVAHPIYSTSTGFISIAGTDVGTEILSSLFNITFQGQQIYGLSVCDPLEDGTYKNPCVHGRCVDSYPWQDAKIKCQCDFGYLNINHDTCIEPSPFFFIGSMTSIQLVLFGIGAVLLVVLIILVYSNRDQSSVKAMSPMCCVNVLLGCLLGDLSILYQAAYETQTVCYAEVVIPAVAFGIVFSMIFLKAFRIYLIFEYPRIARSRFLKDDFLISASIVVAIIDGILGYIYVSASKTEPGSIYFTDIPEPYWTCAPRAGYEKTEFALMIVLFVFNGLIMALCVAIGQMTRQAAAKFSESKAVSAMVYVSLAAIVLGMGVCFGLEPTTTAIFHLHRLVTSIATWMIAVISPIILFGAALKNSVEGGSTRISTSDRSNSSSNESEDNGQNGEVKAFMFKVGIRLNRATSMWKSSNILGIPESDMIIILGGPYSGTFTLSDCSIRVIEKTAAAAKKSKEESIELTVGENKTCFLVEFKCKEHMEEFRGLRSRAAMARNASASLSGTGGTTGQTSGVRQSVASKRISYH